ncbi:MAG: ABC transporter ATP-binding protein [Actinomycetota bacterium]
MEATKAKTPPVVVADNVHVTYEVYGTGKKAKGAKGKLAKKGKVRKVHAVKGVSFVVYEGETIGIIGSNGSGKSSLMRAIAGLYPATEGAIYSSAKPTMLGVGAALLPNLSGEKNITLGGLAMGFSKEEIEEVRDQIVDFSGLSDFIDLPMRTYSQGMSARLRFSIAAARKHDILIIDEALAVGDRQFRLKAEAKIRQMREEAGTVFLVSHNMKSIQDTCTRVLWIEKGDLVMDGNPETVCAEFVKAMEDGKSE